MIFVPKQIVYDNGNFKKANSTLTHKEKVFK